MRIYSSKTYIIVRGNEAKVIDGEALRAQVNCLVDGDRVFEAQLFAIAKERKETYLVDASGQEQPIEPGGTDEKLPT